jgi:hypothetical protein
MPTSVKKIGPLPAFQTPGKSVEETLINAPNTTIINRAKVSNSLKPIMGNERIHVNSLNLLPNEFGPNGEPVYEPDNGDARIRFAGSGWSAIFSSYGTRSKTVVSTDSFVEITFYGTGLNILIVHDNLDRSMNYSLDGVSKGNTGYLAAGSGVITNRNYSSNQVHNIEKELSLDWHTIKISSAGSADFNFYGFEILNENSQIVVPAGTCFSEGEKIEVSSAVLDYNAGFENETSIGQKGGRAVIAVDKEDGVVKKWFTKTDPAVTAGDPTELVTNGTFDTDISGWSNRGSGGGTITWNSGTLHMTSNLEDEYAYQLVPMVAGQKYTIKLDRTLISGSNTFFVRTYQNDGTPGVDATFIETLANSTTEQGTLQFSYTAQFNGELLTFINGSINTINQIDNVSVKEAAYDFLALDDTDHSNEAVYRRINFREFGRNNEFSTLGGSTSDRAFTLDDGTTTLAGDDVQALTNQDLDTLCTATTNDSFTVTFVGTGLDVYGAASADSADEWTVSVDGVLVGTTFFQGRAETLKICSGLPYGTHTVKFLKTVHSVNGGVHDFIVYQPKKPTLPAGAVELAEYNIMADYSDYVWANDETPISSGVLRKQNTREFIYAGTDWSVNENAAGLDVSGKDLFTGTNLGSGQYAETTFFGTGFVLRFRATSIRCSNTTVTLNDSSDFSSIDTTLISGVAGTSWTPATGLLDQNVTSGDDKGVGLVVKGLPLGLHTVRITKNVTTGQLVIGAFDIITPINAPHTTFGSMSVRDLRKFEADNTVNKIIKNYENNLLVNTVEQEIINSEGISQVLRGGNGIFWVYYEEPYIDEEFYVFGTSDSDNSVSAGLPSISDGQSRTPSSVRVYNRNLAGTPEDERRVNITTKHILQKDKFKE